MMTIIPFIFANKKIIIYSKLHNFLLAFVYCDYDRLDDFDG